ncbi:MAG: hypothetical protein GY847_40205 [Proteobacteria bacterium]|nr:hypothetical protein [Pseudomonadota bacterium]
MTRILAICFFLAVLIAFPFEVFGKDPTIVRSIKSCREFTSHRQVGELFASYEKTYPDIARTLSLSDSVQDREIWALLLSANPDEESAEPEIRIVGGIHGNECMSVELVLETIEVLVNGYGDNAFASDLIDRAELVFVPMINPDGHEAETATRENANDIDLNRNFSFAWIDEGDAPFSEPETRAIRDLSQNMSFVLGITYHTVATYLNSSWNYTPHYPPYDELFETMGEAYAGGSGYDVTFGWDWYAINGDLNDWSLGTAGTFDWTVELRKDLDMEKSVHMSGLRDFLSFVFVGASGIITDSVTSKPIPARILVEPEGAPIFNDPHVGDYHRILLPGTYSLTAVAPGYKSQTVQGVTVPTYGTTHLDFQLEPADEDSFKYAFAVTGMTLPMEVGSEYQEVEYLNETMVWDALGQSDSRVYSLSPGGSITLDMGPLSWVDDMEGFDLEVQSGTGSRDQVRVLVAADQDGPFIQVAEGDGDIVADLAESGLDSIRYVRLIDLGDGPFNDEFAGYDLDAVVNIAKNHISSEDAGAKDSGTEIEDTDTENDTDTNTDEDASIDTETDTDSEDDEDLRARTASCACAVSKLHGQKNLLDVILLLFV